MPYKQIHNKNTIVTIKSINFLLYLNNLYLNVFNILEFFYQYRILKLKRNDFFSFLEENILLFSNEIINKFQGKTFFIRMMKI